MTVPRASQLFPALATSTSTERYCYVRNGVTSSFVVPGDWVPVAEAAERVRTYGTPMLGSASNVEHNDLAFSVDGPDTYSAIWDDVQDAIDAVTEDPHAPAFVLHVGWTCYRATPFGSGRTYESLMQTLVNAGVKTRALYWASDPIGAAGNQGISDDKHALEESAAAINAMHPAGVARAYLDSQVRQNGSHHQKIWVILGRRGLVAHFGGVDVHTNRVINTNSTDPWHDVNARVQGPAAERFLGIALWRLMACVDWGARAVPAPEAAPGEAPSAADDLLFTFTQSAHAIGTPPRGLPPRELYAHQVGVHEIYEIWHRYTAGARARRHFGPVRVHAGHTVGNPRIESAGFHSEIHFMVSHAIEQARSFIHVEDQYFWHHEMAQRLGRRVAEGAIKQVVIVTNVSVGLAEHPLHTNLGLWHLAHAAGSAVDRILVFERIGSRGRYLHSKLFVYDDVSAHVGSANFNRRGYAHDSESAGVWVDRVVGQVGWGDTDVSLARKLRVALWVKHLGVNPAHLFDALGASVYWQQLAARTSGFDAPLFTSQARPTVKIAELDGQPWPAWARSRAALEPPSDSTMDPGISVTDGPLEGSEWIVDPA